MRFSIITITCNAEKHLYETLNSVALQTFEDYEHILWDGGKDGGSSDATLEIARQFPKVKIYQGRDEGISDAMNKGAEYARGEFLLHLHADDYLAHENALLIVDTAIRQHPSIQWLYGQIALIDEAGDRKGVGAFHPFDLKRLRKYNTIPHPATFYSRELFMQARGFRNELRYAMDYELFLRLSKKATPFALPKVLTCFREHMGSQSSASPLKVADEAYFVRSLHMQSLWEKLRSYRTWKRRRRKILMQQRQ